MKAGSTGQFPDGKFNDSNEGEVEITVENEGGLVYLRFSKPVYWFVVQPQMAINIAFSLMQQAGLAANEAAGIPESDQH